MLELTLLNNICRTKSLETGALRNNNLAISQGSIVATIGALPLFRPLEVA
ncbi:MAG: hypothetical protein ACI9N3_001229 [Colwellia sp.]|jgi:hypothetical protein